MALNKLGRAHARHWALGVASGALMLSAAGQAQAEPQITTTTQSAPNATDARIQALESEINDLAAQIADLKAGTAANFKDVRDAQSSADAITISNGRPTVSNADGSQKFAVRAMAQFDVAHYDVSPRRTDNDLSSGSNFRRARLGIEGSLGKWNYALTGEFGGSNVESPVLNQAYVEYAGWKPFGLANPVRIRAGAWATPAGLEDATTNTEMVFLERAAIAETVRSFAAGDGRSSFGVFANGDHWYVDGVLTGDTPGLTAEFSEQTGYLARVALNPLYGSDYAVHVGANVSGVTDLADKTAGAVVSKSLTISQQPELRVDDNKTALVSTGAIAATGLTAYGVEFGASWKNLYIASEYNKIDVDRTTAGFKPSFSGWYVQGSWTITGEQHAWSAASGGFRGIRPAKAFDPKKGQWGAWELAGRYSVLNLNDHEGLAGAAAPAGGIRGGEQDITTVGLNWYPNNVVRFLLDYQWVSVDRLSAAGANIGEDTNAISLRSQFAF